MCRTCHGYSLASVSLPPTILDPLLATPQLQGMVAGVGEGVVVPVTVFVVMLEEVVVVPGYIKNVTNCKRKIDRFLTDTYYYQC